MEKFIRGLERRFGRYAIHNLTLYIIVLYVVGYILSLTGNSFSHTNPLEFIQLNPYEIIHGQIWRIITWIIIPPSSLGIFTVIMLFFYYSLGRTLEASMGAFRYNLYIISGMLFTLIAAFILYFLRSFLWVANDEFAQMAYVLGEDKFAGLWIGSSVSTYYVVLSIFLAFATLYPEMKVYLYFIIPIKIKWMAWLNVAFLLYDFFKGNLVTKVLIVASLLNFVMFFLSVRNLKHITPKEIHRKAEFRRQVYSANQAHDNKTADGRISKHKCAICGRTELDDPNLEFRFCSKCNGNYEYCNDHLFTHKHVE